jgi:hypothetical protein
MLSLAVTKLLGVFSDVVNEREKTPVLSHDERIELAEETKGHSNVKLWVIDAPKIAGKVGGIDRTIQANVEGVGRVMDHMRSKDGLEFCKEGSAECQDSDDEPPKLE